MVIGTKKKLARKKSLAERQAPIVSMEFDRYLIKAGWLNGQFVARAFPGTGSRTQGLIAEARGNTEEAAIDALKELILKRNESRKGSRRWDGAANAGIPRESEFAEALGHIKITEAQATMLRTLAVRGDAGMSHDELARAGGYRTPDTATRNLRVLAVLIADYLSAASNTKSDANERWNETMLIAEGLQVEGAAKPMLTMHPELRAAVATSI